jgi:hypothetical protein
MVSSYRTAWHFYFAILLRQRAPRWIEVRDEVPLSDERPRMDYLLLRKIPNPELNDTGQTLCRLWPLIPMAGIAEFKSIGRPYRNRGLHRLCGYMHTYFADARDLSQRQDLVGVLIVVNRTAALDKDVAAMGLEYRDLEDGYWELKGGVFKIYVVEIDSVGDLERDGVLQSFGHHLDRTWDATQFWCNQVGTMEAMMNVDPRKLEGYDEIVRRLMSALSTEQRLAGLAPEQLLAHVAPEQRLAGMPPEQRLTGLSREEILLAFPDDELRRLPESYLATFSESVREAVRRRIGR